MKKTNQYTAAVPLEDGNTQVLGTFSTVAEADKCLSDYFAEKYGSGAFVRKPLPDETEAISEKS